MAETSPALSGTGVGGGYSPADLQSAYGLPGSGGAEQTVAIVDAYDDPNAEADLATYRAEYGLPSCTTSNGCFRKVSQTGGTIYPEPNEEWAGEIALDTDMVSAACPSCHILLVEAQTNSWENLTTAENEAAALGASEISNSYGAPITSAPELSMAYDHSGIPITASSGDYGYGVEFPADSPYVISVGGTALNRSSSSRKWEEAVWYHCSTEGGKCGTGSGCSAEPKPSWQTDTGCAFRTDNDVAAVADNNTPVSAYDSFGSKSFGWGLWGGTSVGSPFMAGVMALSDVRTKSIPGAEALYGDATANGTGVLDDVVAGVNGTCGNYLCEARIGYDGPTGLGSTYGIVKAPPPPAVSARAASAVGERHATLSGTVNPAGFLTTYQFEYWQASSPGTVLHTPATPESVGSGSANVEVRQTISGLVPFTEYVFRLVATSAFGTSRTTIASVTTGPVMTSRTTPDLRGELAKATVLHGGVSCVSEAACIAVGRGTTSSGEVTSVAERWIGANLLGTDEWLRMAVPRPSGATASELLGVSCTAWNACTAVGLYRNASGATFALAEQWDGAQWVVESTPNPSGSEVSELTAVSCTSPAECTAVGRYVANGKIGLTLAERWNGTEWTLQSTQNTSGPVSAFESVSCSAPHACTAVGIGSSGSNFGPLAEAWNGSAWSIQTTPSVGGSPQSLLGVSCLASNACTAVGGGSGSTLAERWNGSEWTGEPTGGLAHGILYSVSCRSSTSCTAVGTEEGEVKATTAVWSGAQWTNATTTTPPGAKKAILRGVSCVATATCSAVGEWEDGSGEAHPLAEGVTASGATQQATPKRATDGGLRGGISCVTEASCIAVGRVTTTAGTISTLTEQLSSGEWSRLVSANPPEAVQSELLGVTCRTVKACTAVGLYRNAKATYPLAEQWNGEKWTIEPTPNPSGSEVSELSSVSCTSANACTAVGHYAANGKIGLTLAERWNGTEWSIQSTPNASGQVSALEGVSCSSAKACTAVGIGEESGGFGHLIEAWNGSEWVIQQRPSGGEGFRSLLSVSCATTNNCTAVGGGGGEALAEQWNGGEWAILPTGNLPSGLLYSVSCDSAASCTAVGSQEGEAHAASFHWNGIEWISVATPTPSGARKAALLGVSCVASMVCDAVGEWEDQNELDAAQATAFGAPTAKTEPASSITSISATLNALIEPGGGETTYHLEYGTTKSYGTSVPIPDAPLESDTEPHAVDESITGLQPLTTYHYRVVATNSAGQAVGKDAKFKTE